MIVEPDHHPVAVIKTPPRSPGRKLSECIALAAQNSPNLFKRDMLRHQLGQNLIFGLDLLLQILDSFLFSLMAAPAFLLESGRAVFKELLLIS